MSDPQIHLLLNRVAEQTAQIEAVRALCERRITDPEQSSRVSADEVLALLDGGSDE